MTIEHQFRVTDKLCLSQAEAAAYMGVSLGHFLSEVKKRNLPQPKSLGSRKLWVRAELERAFGLTPAPMTVDRPHKKRVFE